MSALTAPRPVVLLASRLNWLRAGVLGANDGIVSTAGLVFGVAGATSDPIALLIAGFAGLVAGALSMAGGEFVSVSTQRDTERSALAELRSRLRANPDAELEALAGHYAAGGLPEPLAHRVAAELSAHDAETAHARARLGIDAEEPANPWHAAWASLAAFSVGALIPLLGLVLAPPPVRLPVTLAAVLAALIGTGYLSARLGGSAPGRPVARNVLVGALAMGLTYAAGSVVGAHL